MAGTDVVLLIANPGPTGRRAVEVALALARASGARLQAIAAIPLSDPRAPRRGATTAMSAFVVAADADDEELRWVAMRAHECGIPCQLELLAAGDRPRAFAGHARLLRPAAVVLPVEGPGAHRTLRLVRRAARCEVVAVHGPRRSRGTGSHEPDHPGPACGPAGS